MSDHGAENANLERDLAVALALVGRRPRWLWPSWLFGQAYA